MYIVYWTLESVFHPISIHRISSKTLRYAWYSRCLEIGWNTCFWRDIIIISIYFYVEQSCILFLWNVSLILKMWVNWSFTFKNQTQIFEFWRIKLSFRKSNCHILKIKILKTLLLLNTTVFNETNVITPHLFLFFQITIIFFSGEQLLSMSNTLDNRLHTSTCWIWNRLRVRRSLNLTYLNVISVCKAWVQQFLSQTCDWITCLTHSLYFITWSVAIGRKKMH